MQSAHTSALTPSPTPQLLPSPFSGPVGHTCEQIDVSELEFVKCIGRGGFGEVWLARWREDTVAVKKLLRPDESSDAAREIEREIKMLFECEHPYITQLHGSCPNPCSLVMEFCEGGSVKRMLKEASKGNPDARQRLSWRQRLVMLGQVASGMYYLHQRNIIHGDLRSYNLLLDFFLRAKIADFGLSRTILDSRSHYSASAITHPGWTAPEVLESSKITTASDVYAFGICMWELLTWEEPFKGISPFTIIYQVPNMSARPDIPPDDKLPGQPGPTLGQYKELMMQCWAQDPAVRPSFAEIWERVQVMIGQESELSLEHGDPVLSVSIRHGRMASSCSSDLLTTPSALEVSSLPGLEASQDLDSVSGATSLPVPSPSPQPAIPQHPDTLDDLLDILAEAQSSSITVDLQGQELCVSRSEGQHLVIRRPVLLCNGTLNLPRGVGILIVSAGVTLRSMTLTSAGLAVNGLVSVLENGAVRLESCGLSICGADIATSLSGSPAGCGVIVESSSHADIQDTRISGAPGAGLRVSGSVNAESCTISNCSTGFTVAGCGALLTVSDCTAKGNRSAGFLAENAGWLTCMKNCLALHNGVGFCAQGKGSSLIAGQGSRAEHNKGCGFRASEGGKLMTAEECQALNNHVGFAAYDEGSSLTAGKRCLAERNAAYGFAAWIGGKMIIGDECRAVGNHVGFASYDLGSFLQAGKGSVAASNEEYGFSASAGAKMITAEECLAIGNKLGFASGEYSSLVVGQGSRVARSKDAVGGSASEDGDTPKRVSLQQEGPGQEQGEGVQNSSATDKELQGALSPSGGSYQAAVRIIHGLASKPLTFLKDIRSLSSNGWGAATVGSTAGSLQTPGAKETADRLSPR